MNSIELKLLRSINDPIHGSIKLTNEEMSIIGEPLFRRLHHVKQNSFLYKVFPSAKHTRFEHSIGVMHLATKMFQSIIENSEVASQRGDIVTSEEDYNKYLDEELEVGINLYSYFNTHPDVYKNAIVTLRYASLLHDIGHGPLSHLFDSFAPNVEEFKAILHSDKSLVKNNCIYDGLLNVISDHNESEIKKGKNPSEVRIEHEHVSLYFIYKILTSIEINPIVIGNVMTIIKPSMGIGQFKIDIFNSSLNLLPLLSDIVASAPIDCDRMDYLKRDSYFSGVPYGNYSEDRVLKTLLPYTNKEDIRLGLKTSGLHAVENFLQARYELFVQVYGHKTNEACAAILEFVCSKKVPFGGWSEIDFNNQENLYTDFQNLYIKLTDESFLDLLIQYFDNTEDSKRVAALSKLKLRNLWKRVYEIEEFISKNHKDTEVDKVFNQKVSEMKEIDGYKDIRKYSTSRFPLKDLEKGAKLLEKSSKSVYIVSSIPLNKASQIIESLNHGLRVWRIYGIDTTKIENYKAYIRENIQSSIDEAQKKDLEDMKRDMRV